MRKRKSTFTVTVLAMLLLCAAFLLTGCQNMETGALRRGADQDQTTEGTAQTSQETPAAETVAEASTEEAADEIDPETMASRLYDGLYLAGEVIDVDGPCGGYNLHFAFASALVAARAMAAQITGQKGQS